MTQVRNGPVSTSLHPSRVPADATCISIIIEGEGYVYMITLAMYDSESQLRVDVRNSLQPFDTVEANRMDNDPVPGEPSYAAN